MFQCGLQVFQDLKRFGKYSQVSISASNLVSDYYQEVLVRVKF